MMEGEDSNYTCSGSSSLKSDSTTNYSHAKDAGISTLSKHKYKASTIKRKFGFKKRKRIFQRRKLPDDAIPIELFNETVNLAETYDLENYV